MTTIDRSRSNWGKDSQISEFWIAGCGERKWKKKNGGEKIGESSDDGARIMGSFSLGFMGLFLFYHFYYFGIKS